MVECPAGELAGFFMRFMKRDLLWLVVVVAVAVAWCIDRGKLESWHISRFNQLSREVTTYLRTKGGEPVKVDDRGVYVGTVLLDGRDYHK
jgi:hypothetical protein